MDNNFKVITDALNTYFKNNCLGKSDRMPTSGDYKIGDIIISSMQIGGVFGWVCTKGGNPGSWRELKFDGSSSDGESSDGGSSLSEEDIIKLIENHIPELDTSDLALKADVSAKDAEHDEAIKEIKYDLEILEGLVESAVDVDLSNLALKSDVSKKDAELDEAIAAVQKEVDTLEGAVGNAALKADVNKKDAEHDASIEAIQKDIEAKDAEYNAALEALEAKDAEHDEAMEAIQKDIEVLEGLVENAGDVDLSNLALKSDVEAKDAEHDEAIEAIQKDIETLEGLVENAGDVDLSNLALKSDVEAINEDLVEINDNITANDNDIKAIQDDMAELKEDVVYLGNDIENIDEIILNSDAIDNIKNQMGELNSLETTNKSDLVSAINELNTKYAELLALYEQLKSDVENNNNNNDNNDDDNDETVVSNGNLLKDGVLVTDSTAYESFRELVIASGNMNQYYTASAGITLGCNPSTDFYNFISFSGYISDFSEYSKINITGYTDATDHVGSLHAYIFPTSGYHGYSSTEAPMNTIDISTNMVQNVTKTTYTLDISDWAGLSGYLGIGTSWLTGYGNIYITDIEVVSNEDDGGCESIAFTKESITISGSETYNLNEILVIKPDDCEEEVSWYTDSNAVAVADGIVTVLNANAGSAKVQAVCGGRAATILVNVSASTSEGLVLYENGVVYTETPFADMSISSECVGDSRLEFSLNSDNYYERYFSYNGYVDLSAYNKIEITAYTELAQQTPLLLVARHMTAGEYGYNTSESPEMQGEETTSVRMMYNKVPTVYSLPMSEITTEYNMGYLGIYLRFQSEIGGVYISKIEVFPN